MLLFYSSPFWLYPRSLGYVHELASCVVFRICADHHLLRLRKLAEWTRDPHIVTVNKMIPLRDWYHVDGPLALVGQAAQSLAVSHCRMYLSSLTSLSLCSQPGSAQEAAIPFEDGVTLGRIFSHLRQREQIRSFLEAYEDVCRDRDITAYEKELGDAEFMTLPPEYADTRDAYMREKGKDGRNLFEVDISMEDNTPGGLEEWRRIIDQFAYNCEDAADNWWQSEGKFIEATRGGLVDGPILRVLVAQNIKEN